MKNSKHIPRIVTGTQWPNDRMIGHTKNNICYIGLHGFVWKVRTAKYNGLKHHFIYFF